MEQKRLLTREMMEREHDLYFCADVAETEGIITTYGLERDFKFFLRWSQLCLRFGYDKYSRDFDGSRFVNRFVDSPCVNTTI
jgi:hypothetical protein